MVEIGSGANREIEDTTPSGSGMAPRTHYIARSIFGSDTMSNRTKNAHNEANEAADDAFYNALYEEYKADSDKSEAISLEEAVRQLGVA